LVRAFLQFFFPIVCFEILGVLCKCNVVEPCACWLEKWSSLNLWLTPFGSWWDGGEKLWTPCLSLSHFLCEGNSCGWFGDHLNWIRDTLRSWATSL
jgi:hypothetical protein